MKANTSELKLELNVEVTDEDIDDIMLYSRKYIKHWCSKVEVDGECLGGHDYEQISRGGRLFLYVSDDREEKFVLTKELFLRGLKMYLLKESVMCLCMLDGTYVIDPICIEDGGEDKIIQYALFGDIRYA